MIARLSQGSLIPCPKQGRDGYGKLHSNLSGFYERHPDIAAEDGYYPVRFTDKPDGDYVSSWIFSSGEIVQVWTPYTPEPEPVDPIIERFEFIEDCLMEISEKLWN